MNEMIADRTQTIMQGTTPSLTITISEDDFLLSNVSAIDFKTCSGSNWKKIVSYTMADLIIDTENNTLTKKFDAQETANFSGGYVTVQARFIFPDGSIVGINKITFAVADMIGVGKDG